MTEMRADWDHRCCHQPGKQPGKYIDIRAPASNPAVYKQPSDPLSNLTRHQPRGLCHVVPPLSLAVSLRLLVTSFFLLLLSRLLRDVLSLGFHYLYYFPAPQETGEVWNAQQDISARHPSGPSSSAALLSSTRDLAMRLCTLQ